MLLLYLYIEDFIMQVAYPYVAKRLLTDPNPALRERLIQVGLVLYGLCSLFFCIY